jgi:hypothetical protein
MRVDADLIASPKLRGRLLAPSAKQKDRDREDYDRVAHRPNENKISDG